MEEQSHKDEMRAALRGDFERMRRRLSQGETEIDERRKSEVAEGRAPEAPGVNGPKASWLDRVLGRT